MVSSVEYRKRLREQAERDRQFHLTGFRPQDQHPRFPAASPSAIQPTKATTVTADPVIVDTTPPVRPPEYGEQQPQPLGEIPAIQIPRTTGMTPTQLREQGKVTAEVIAQLPQDQYLLALSNLETTNPNLYGVVVDELNNMSPEEEAGEGDGYDLSAITSHNPNPTQGAESTVGESNQEQVPL